MVMRLVILVCLTVPFYGCIPVVAGTAIMKSASDNKAKATSRAEFLSNHNENNTQREINGLKPLDLCDAKVTFDRKWAFEDSACKEKWADK
jgi:hypothetical protein